MAKLSTKEKECWHCYHKFNATEATRERVNNAVRLSCPKCSIILQAIGPDGTVTQWSRVERTRGNESWVSWFREHVGR